VTGRKLLAHSGRFKSTGHAINADTRYSFVGQHLSGAAIFTRKANEIENLPNFTDPIKTEHRAYVWSAIVQSASELEAHIAEIFMHGPGHHLGSNGTDTKAREHLRPLWKKIERKRGLGVIGKYDFMLKELGKQDLDKKAEWYEAAILLLNSRNALVHYKSKWGAEMQDEKSLYAQLERLGLLPPPFATSNTNFFPHRCLSASFASWSVDAAVQFINELYKVLQISSPLINYDLSVPPPRRI
jgi:hypothetical protein